MEFLESLRTIEGWFQVYGIITIVAMVTAVVEMVVVMHFGKDNVLDWIESVITKFKKRVFAKR